MEHSQFERLKAEIATDVSADQILDLEQVIRLIAYKQIADMALARRSNSSIERRICPHCKGSDVVLHGKDKNQRQRFKCRECRRTYNILTGTPMARARKPEKWGNYLSSMTDHTSIRKIAATDIGLNHVTVWRWRHRFLKAATNDNSGVLSGVIEADETFFVRSFKGHRGWQNGKPPAQRAARPRAWGATKRGLSSEQVPVLTALDNAGAVFEAILPSLTAIQSTLDGRIARGSVLCSDGARGYVKAAVSAVAEHRRIIVPTTAAHATKTNTAPTQRRQKGRLGLGHVNAHHERLKTFINRHCRGVSTRYLDNYLGWHRAMMRKGFAGNELLNRALIGSQTGNRLDGGLHLADITIVQAIFPGVQRVNGGIFFLQKFQ